MESDKADAEGRGIADARKAIVDHTKGRRGVCGEISCPICSTGKLRFSVAKSNGHIWAACSTKSCVRWME